MDTVPVPVTKPKPPAELFDRPSILGNNAIPSMLELAPAKRILSGDLARFIVVLKVSNTLFNLPALTYLVAELEFASASTDGATRRDAIAMADAQAGGMKLDKPQTLLHLNNQGGKP